MFSKRYYNFRGLKCDQEGSRKDFKIYRLYSRNTVYVNVRNESNTCNNRGTWNQLKIIIKISEQHIWSM